jgi:flagellar biosynthesis protein FlhF
MGRNPNNRDEINDLLGLQATINSMQTPFTNCYTFLVLSATTSASSMQNNIKKFSDFNVSSAIITHIDEAFGLGNIITSLSKTNIPISYFTNGQKIPDDIEQADKERLNDYLFVV